MRVDKFKRGQIWWLNDDKNYDGNVQGGNRPVIIVSNDLNNRFSNNVTIVPCTSKEKQDIPTHYTFKISEQSTALAEQIRTISKEKIGNYIGTCDKELLQKIDEIIKIALGLTFIPTNKSSVLENTNLAELNTDKTISQSNLIVTNCVKQGRKSKYSLQEMQRFVDDYYNHNAKFMVKKYNEVSEKAVTNKVYRFKKIIGENK